MRSSLSQRSTADPAAASSEDLVEALPQAPEPDVVDKELAHGEQIKRIPRRGGLIRNYDEGQASGGL